MEILVDGVRWLPEPTRKMDIKPFNEVIAAARESKNETLDTAAGNMGIAKSQLWSMEKGETEPKLQMLQKVLRYYGIAFEQISDV
jgi:transcriptional regulator with XRE-family HTH domain